MKNRIFHNISFERTDSKKLLCKKKKKKFAVLYFFKKKSFCEIKHLLPHTFKYTKMKLQMLK